MRNLNLDNKKYAVGLSRTANSFFDPDCGANLFKSSPIYQFDHKPTNTILNAIKNGRLYDLKGNLSENKEKAGEVDIEKIRAELEVEIRTSLEKDMRAAIEEDVRAELDKEYDKKLKAEISKIKKDEKK